MAWRSCYCGRRLAYFWDWMNYVLSDKSLVMYSVNVAQKLFTPQPLLPEFLKFLINLPLWRKSPLCAATQVSPELFPFIVERDCGETKGKRFMRLKRNHSCSGAGKCCRLSLCLRLTSYKRIATCDVFRVVNCGGSAVDSPVCKWRQRQSQSTLQIPHFQRKAISEARWN